MIENLFELDANDFKVHSLAFDATYENEPRFKVATVSFRVRPTALCSTSPTMDAWDFDLPSTPKDSIQPNSVRFDTHFKGFTPLSPADRDEYSIE